MPPDSNGKLLEEELTESVIGTFYEVYDELGFGFREYVYSLAMERALRAKGHKVARERRVTVYFRGEPLTWEKIDLVVDEKVIVENKSTERLHPDATSQPFGYVAATNIEVALLLHFGRQPKFYRMVFENRFKRRNAIPHPPPSAPPH